MPPHYIHAGLPLHRPLSYSLLSLPDIQFPSLNRPFAMETLLPAIVGPAVGGAIALLLIWKFIPDMLKAFRAEMAEERKQHGQHIDRIVGRLELLEHGVMSIQEQLLRSRGEEEPLPVRPRPAA